MSLSVPPNFATRLYLETVQSKSRVVIHRGGTRSSKTYSLAQFCCDVLEREPGKLIGIFRKTFPALRMGVMPDVIDMLKARGTYHLMRHNLSESTLLNPVTQTKLIFSSVDDPQKLRGPEWNYLWLNEANEFSYEDYRQFSLRMSRRSSDGKKNRIFLDFNPDDPDIWIKTKLEDQGRAQVIVSTYKDNPFLTPEDRAEIEHLEHTDPNFWNVFGLGQYGTRNKGLILTDWRYGEASQAAGGDLTPEIFGLDFGFNNPTALIGVQWDRGKNLYLREILYRSGLINADVITLLRELDIPKAAHLYADAAEPARIEEIRRAGWLNVQPANKNVKPGLDFLKRFTLVLSGGEGTNLSREVKRYKWRETKNGDLLDEPVKFDDHGIDAARYAAFTHGAKFWAGTNTVTMPSAGAVHAAGGGSKKDGDRREFFKGYY